MSEMDYHDPRAVAYREGISACERGDHEWHDPSARCVRCSMTKERAHELARIDELVSDFMLIQRKAAARAGSETSRELLRRDGHAW